MPNDPQIVARVLATPDPADIPEVSRGWHLDGPGPARHGWAWTYPTGRVRYLAPTWVSVRDWAAHWDALVRLRAAIAATVAGGA
jgi:hypothetical protein